MSQNTGSGVWVTGWRCLQPVTYACAAVLNQDAVCFLFDRLPFVQQLSMLLVMLLAEGLGSGLGLRKLRAAASNVVKFQEYVVIHCVRSFSTHLTQMYAHRICLEKMYSTAQWVVLGRGHDVQQAVEASDTKERNLRMSCPRFGQAFL